MKRSSCSEAMRCGRSLAGWAGAVLATAAAFGQGATDGPAPPPFPVPDVRRPVFPDAEFPITGFGARAGGEHDVSRAVAAAIEACAMRGGGRVVVPAGLWRTGPIHLKSGVELHLEAGATLRFSDRFDDYLPPVFVRHGGIEIYNYSPLVYARDCVNVAVTGRGVLEGNAERWWAWKKKETRRPFEMSAEVPVAERVFGTEEAAIRPSFMAFVGCRGVLLEGVTITSGPNWTVHPIYCEDVLIRGVTIDTHGPNNDGIDIDSCRNVIIEECRFNTGDDCVVLKSGYNQDGWRVGRPTENVVMRRCVGRNGHGGLVIGSEMSGDVRNVLLQDCEFEGTDHVLRIKSRIDRGGIVERIHVDGVRARDLKRDVVLLTMGYTADRVAIGEVRPPVFRDIVVANVTAQGTPAAIIVEGLQESPIEDCRFENLVIRGRKGMRVKHARELTMRAVEIHVEEGPACDVVAVQGLTLDRVILAGAEDPQLQVGAGTTGVQVIDCDFAARPDAVRRESR